MHVYELSILFSWQSVKLEPVDFHIQHERKITKREFCREALIYD